MPLRERFSKNLKRLCQSEKSYAHVARQLGISRQQMNDYLTGKSLPNETIIRNICRYFDIDISDLFKLEQSAVSRAMPWQAMQNRATISVKPNIDDGFYFCDFFLNDITAATSNIGMIRSLLAVERHRQMTTFRRITRVDDFFASRRSRKLGNHIGYVTTVEAYCVFVGVNKSAPFEPSILVAREVFSPSIDYAGLAFTVGDKYRTSQFALTSVSGLRSVRQMIAETGYVEVKNNNEAKIILSEAAAFLRSRP